jgi:uncharacterized protein involved in outer membrane biogenesis
MNRPLLVRRVLFGLATLLAVALLTIGSLMAALEKGFFREPLIRFVSARAGRALDIEGPIELHLFTLHPRVTVQRITVGNPSWMPPGNTARLDRLSLTFGLPWFHRSFALEKLAMADGQLTLLRNDAGLANWLWHDPRGPEAKPLPLLRSLSATDLRATLQDDVRHLQFDGTVTAHEPDAAGTAKRLTIEGTGELNGHAVQFAIDGEPLAAAERGKSYQFTFSEQSSGSRLDGHGTLPKPFDFRVIDATFEATGEDLRDLYYLVGTKLVNTGAYKLTGEIARRGAMTKFNDLKITSGQSDAHATIAVDSSGVRPKVVIDVDSQHLRLADLGLRAAGRETQNPGAPRLLMSAVAIDPQAWRRDDTVATVHARRLDVGRIAIQDLAAKLTVDHGVLTVAPFSGRVLDGRLSGHARADLTTETPAASIDLTLNDANLEHYPSTSAEGSPLKGLLHARVVAQGHGRSLHEFAASADGTVSAVVSHGVIRTALVEIVGLDAGAMKLLFEHPTPETSLTCAVSAFEAHGGVLNARTLLLDTEPMLVTGTGTIQMDTESLDLTLRAHAKHPALRVRSPVQVRGVLTHPTVGIQPGGAAAQTAAAVALGVLLTPLASVLAFVDPGLAKDADCEAVSQTAQAIIRSRPPRNHAAVTVRPSPQPVR